MWNIIPLSIKELHQLFKENNKSLFVVGGAVRDFLLGTEVNDYDLVTDATPDEVLNILNNYRTNSIGKSFGVVVAYTEDGEYEIATFRTDIYGDNLGKTRNPDVKFSTINEDVFRRDLTCGALFYDLERREIIDLVDGINDIKNKIIKFVGEPTLRIKEDALRIMRSIRFATRYNFKIDDNSAKCIHENVKMLKIIEPERIWKEILKAYEQSIDFNTYIKYIIDFGIANVIFDSVKINKDIKKSNFLEIYIANMFILNPTKELVEKMKKHFKITHDFSRTVVFLLELLNIEPNRIREFYNKSYNISRILISEWYSNCGINDSSIHKAFLKYKPSVNALELMAQGLQGNKLGAKINELEIINFIKLIENEVLINAI